MDMVSAVTPAERTPCKYHQTQIARLYEISFSSFWDYSLLRSVWGYWHCAWVSTTNLSGSMLVEQCDAGSRSEVEFAAKRAAGA